MDLAIFVVPAAAAAAPLLAAAVGRFMAVPLVVFEILLGMMIGPSGFGWVVDGDVLEGFSHLGLAMLFFMAGNELEVRALRGASGRRALGGWGISLVFAAVAGLVIAQSAGEAAIVAIALTGTALGTITPIIRDAGLNRGKVGEAIVGAGAVGEFGPLVAITVFLSGMSPLGGVAMLLLFVAVAAGAFYSASKRERPWLVDTVNATLDTSGQFGVRLVVFLMAGLVALALALKVDYLLGAFTAGLLARVVLRGVDPERQKIIQTKLDALAFGFLVPLFFVTTGITFPLDSLFSSGKTVLLVPVLALVMLGVRGVPSALFVDKSLSLSDRRTVGLFAATTLPLVIAVTTIGTRTGAINETLAAALVGAGMLTVLLFPMLALIGRSHPTPAGEVDRPEDRARGSNTPGDEEV